MGSNERLKRPAASEPSTLPKSGFPGDLLTITRRNIRKVHIAFGRITVPTEHGIDGFGKLGAAGFVNAFSVPCPHWILTPCACVSLLHKCGNWQLYTAVYEGPVWGSSRF